MGDQRTDNLSRTGKAPCLARTFPLGLAVCDATLQSGSCEVRVRFTSAFDGREQAAGIVSRDRGDHTRESETSFTRSATPCCFETDDPVSSADSKLPRRLAAEDREGQALVAAHSMGESDGGKAAGSEPAVQTEPEAHEGVSDEGELGAVVATAP